MLGNHTLRDMLSAGAIRGSKHRRQGGPGEPIDSKSPHRIAAKVIE
jgi:hypothetical protein